MVSRAFGIRGDERSRNDLKTQTHIFGRQILYFIYRRSLQEDLKLKAQLKASLDSHFSAAGNELLRFHPFISETSKVFYLNHSILRTLDS